ncbi:GtrA family protein [Phyllobacterium pellucidum]|uniref:GtrA family protein n=1 Tax=Phyllobacterium pellucidum TaxID=2740464 RepID=UPI001D1371F9
MLTAANKVHRLIRFGLVGGANTVAYFILANALVYIIGVQRELSAYFAYALILPFSFFGHRRFTFRSRGNAMSEWVRFCVMQGVCLSIIAGVNAFSKHYPASLSWVAFAAISFLIPVINFLMMQAWVFATRGKAS